MGLYNVIQPCVVNKRHHVRPTTQPIEVDDAVAASGVEAGCLEPYRPAVDPAEELVAHDEESGHYESAAEAGRETGEEAVASVRGMAEAAQAGVEIAERSIAKARPRGGRRRTED